MPPSNIQGSSMPADNQFTPAWGTALATFTQTGTYSSVVQLSRPAVALYSDNFPSAAGSIIFRASANPSGTGHPIQTASPVAAGDGTILKVLTFGSGTFYSLNTVVSPAPLLPFLILQIGTAGTAGVAAGGTIVLVTAP